MKRMYVNSKQDAIFYVPCNTIGDLASWKAERPVYINDMQSQGK